MRVVSIAALLLAPCVFGATPAYAQTPPHLAAAEHLVDDLLLSETTAPAWPNVYGLDAYIDWSGSTSSARTECSSFATLLWRHVYGWSDATFKAWTGHTGPDAAVYHDTIAAHDDFIEITQVDDIVPGDVIAIAYYPEYQSPSGHLMIVRDFPQSHSSSPIVAGTLQWTIAVVDSSSSYHGTGDTRYDHPGGIGEGVFRLYTNADGTVAGYTWSLLGTSLSSYYPQATSTASGHHLVIGRLAKSLFQSGFESF
jgi:hypothetical protein